jgi:peptidoglycan/xylan/chitin deacetylase (PgdA/CDA1 family)
VSATLVLLLVVVLGGVVVEHAGAARAAGPGLVVARVQTTKRWVALTFDDGPHPMWTPLVQERLAQAHIPATFFLIGHDVAQRPDLMRDELARGEEVGDHTFRHSMLTRLRPGKARAEIRAGLAAIVDNGGPRPVLFRPPYGKTSEAIDAMARAEGMRTILWDLSLEHFVLHEPVAKGVAKLVDEVRPGSIILAHDGGKSNRSRTLEALPLLIAQLKARGYRFVTVSQLLAEGTAEAERA